MKRIFLTFLLLLTSFSVFAFDFGGILSTTSYVQDSVSNLSFNQYVETTLWTRANLGKNTTFSTEFFYSFNGDFANASELQAGKNSTFTNKFDLSNIKFTSKFYLENGTILSIDQHNNDRICIFKIRKTDEIGDISIKYLIVELFNKDSNIIITKDII